MPRMLKKLLVFTTGALLIAIIGGFAAFSPLRTWAFPKRISLPIVNGQYAVQELSQPPMKSDIQLPDISSYTYENVKNKIPALTVGEVGLRPLADIKEMEKFSEPQRLEEFSRLQKRDMPQVIVISSGVYNLAGVAEAINDPAYIETRENEFILKVPLLVGPDAVLSVSGTPEKKLFLRMSSHTGGYLVNAGKLFIVDADVSAWDEQTGLYAMYKKKDAFRPFIASWSGSETYFARSNFWHLGYGASKSYGITFSIDNDMLKVRPHLPRPTGWIVDSRFEGLYYGFYSYEADDVALIRNVYADNIVYAIDPHDRSERLIIAYNETYGTQKRHGIIVSRAVNHSWIIYNYSHHNNGSGIMLDRSSINNLIAYNVAEYNNSDGITLFESQDNIIIGNKLHHNRKNGLRLRNSWNIKTFDNLIYKNEGAGVQTYAAPINEDDRNMELDPYTQQAGIMMSGDVIALNRAGGFKFENFDSLQLHNLSPLFVQNTPFRLDLTLFKDILPHVMRTADNGIEIRKLPENPQH